MEIRSSWHSYPSVFNLGHRAVKTLCDYPHVCEEKIDGSQFSFGVFDLCDEENSTELRVRSKGAVMLASAPEKMFTKAVESVKARQHLLHVGWTYRAEYLRKPAHNVLAYDRVPDGHLVIFDVSTDDQGWLDPDEKREEAQRIGLECVPVLNRYTDGDYETMTLERLRMMLDTTGSMLGGQLIEGVVIKPLVPLFGVDKKTLMGKFVSERFKESHAHSWREGNPTSGGIIDRLAKQYTAEGRWLKAVQHLREVGLLTDSPADIGKLIPEVRKDVGQECKNEIMRVLWKWAWPHLERRLTAGLPEWYKELLLKRQFEHDPLCAEGTPAGDQTMPCDCDGPGYHAVKKLLDDATDSL